MKHSRGFTLIELMIVVAIIGIIASVAYPSYVEYVRNTRRATGTGCVVEMTQFMERYYTSKMTYAGAALPACDGSISTFYTVEFAADPTANAYSIRAVPSGAQSEDRCGTLSINQAGTKTSSSSYTDCWK